MELRHQICTMACHYMHDEDDVKQPCKKTEYKQVGQLRVFVLCMYSYTMYSDNLEGLHVLLQLQI